MSCFDCIYPGFNNHTLVWGLLRNWILTNVICCRGISLPVSSNSFEWTWCIVGWGHTEPVICFCPLTWCQSQNPQTEVPHGCDQRAHPQKVLAKGWDDFDYHVVMVIWKFPKMGVSLNHPFEWVFPLRNQPFLGTCILGNLHVVGVCWLDFFCLILSLKLLSYSKLKILGSVLPWAGNTIHGRLSMPALFGAEQRSADAARCQCPSTMGSFAEHPQN